jgi:hypothetical protein
MATQTVAFTQENVSSDERWAAWLAKGVEHDRKAKKRLIAIAAAIAAGGALSLGIFLLR